MKEPGGGQEADKLIEVPSPAKKSIVVRNDVQ
jgi:hypothetical protein